MIMNKLNSQKGFVVPLVIAVVVILVGGGVYLARNKTTNSISNAVSSTTTVTILTSNENSSVIKNQLNQDLTGKILTVTPITFPNNSNKINGGSTVPFLSFTLKADNGDVQIDSIKIKKTGTLSNYYLKNIFLVNESNTIVYDESVNREAMSGGKLNSNSELTMTGPVLLKSGETQRFYLYVALDEDLKYAKGDTVMLEISALNIKPANVSIVGDWRVKSPTMIADRYENAMPDPVISSVVPDNGPVGTSVVLKGTRFAGFESDKNAIIENYFGQRGIIYGETGSTDSLIKFKLADRYCTRDMSYIGDPCTTFMIITPGVYWIYVSPWGKSSNKIQFTVTN